jgi:hypothetical protein
MPFWLPNRSDACCTDFAISQYDGSSTDYTSNHPCCFYVGQLQLLSNLVQLPFTHGQSLQPSLRFHFSRLIELRPLLLPASHDPGESSTCNLHWPARNLHFFSLFALLSFTPLFTIFITNVSHLHTHPTQESNFCPSLSPQQHENTRPLSCLIPILVPPLVPRLFPLTWTPVFLLVLGQHFCRA